MLVAENSEINWKYNDDIYIQNNNINNNNQNNFEENTINNVMEPFVIEWPLENETKNKKII